MILNRIVETLQYGKICYVMHVIHDKFANETLKAFVFF